jgi:hypothetical protein
VRHADRDLVEPRLGGCLADLVEQRNGGLTTFQAEPFLTDEFGLQERLEGFCLVELEQDPQLLLAGRLLMRSCAAS